MGLYRTNGQRIKKADLATSPVTTNPEVVITEDVYEQKRANPEDTTINGKIKVLLIKAGTVLRQNDVNALFQAATVTSISAAGGSTAGGTVVTITGTNLDGVSGVTFGGVAGTSFSVLSPTQVRVTTPAHAAGAVTVVVQDDAGDVTKANFYTYA